MIAQFARRPAVEAIIKLKKIGRIPESAPQAPVIAQALYSYQIGGSERVAADLAVQLKTQGYEVICFAVHDSDGPIKQELLKKDVRCVDLNFLSRPLWSRKLSYPLEVYRFLRRNRVSRLLVHHATSLTLCGIAARLALVKRIVVVEHSVHQFKNHPKQRRNAVRYLPTAHSIIAVAPSIVSYLRDTMRIRADRLTYIANSVSLRLRDTQAMADTRLSLELKASDFVFLFAGRLVLEKDVATLLKAVALIPLQQREGLKLLIAGDGTQRVALERARVLLGLEGSVHFLGARADIPALMNAADAFILTSVTEGQPMALLEAMAAGLPCIATRVGGIRDLLGDERGLMAAAKDCAEIARLMILVRTDKALATAYANKGMDYIKTNHDPSHITDQYLRQLSLPPSD